MGLGIATQIGRLYVHCQVVEFATRVRVLGWDNALHRLSRMDKRSLLPILRRHGARVGERCDIEPGIVFHNCQGFDGLQIGDDCHVGKGCLLDLRGGIRIGSRVTVSMRCNLITHHDFGRSSRGVMYPSDAGGVTLQDDVYLGAGVTVLKGVEVGRGSVAAAGAVITQDHGPGKLLAGVPARVAKVLA
jgi:acetyltransferase-like isoleucine patch superfamily enzyme